MSDALRQAIEASQDSQEVAQLRARIRQLEAVVSKLEQQVFWSMAGGDPGDRVGACVSIKTIAEMVTAQTGISLMELKSRRRNVKVAVARHLFWYLAKENTKKTLMFMGQFLEKDHTSVIHGIKKTKARMESDENFKRKVEAISGDIRRLSQ